MSLRNRQGTPVDPVPVLVVVSANFLLCFSFGPVYCLALGTDLTTAVAISTTVFVGLTVAAYHQMVWTARPELRGEVSAQSRLQRLFYAVLIATLVLLSLSLLYYRL